MRNRFQDPAVQVITIIVVIVALMLTMQVIRAVENGTFPPTDTPTQETPTP